MSDLSTPMPEALTHFKRTFEKNISTSITNGLDKCVFEL